MPIQKALTEADVQQFIEDGFVRINHAFSEELATEARKQLWADTGCNPNNPATWNRPVIRLGDYSLEPFRQAANTPLLHAAFDQLAGKGRWLPRSSMGTFPVRFPSQDDPGDTGWHVDASFPGDDSESFFSWRVNIHSRGRALLMLFLFSDVGEKDAPTRIRTGSHLDVANILAPAGDKGMTFLELAEKLDLTANRPVTLATGKAGTVYLCHPFLVHASQPHRGSYPRFMAQPPLLPAQPFRLYRQDNTHSPVEKAILLGLASR